MSDTEELLARISELEAENNDLKEKLQIEIDSNQIMQDQCSAYALKLEAAALKFEE